jgi:MFS family permease
VLIRSAVGTGPAAPSRPPLVDHDRQCRDRLLPILLRQWRGPRRPHHHLRCTTFHSRHTRTKDAAPHGKRRLPLLLAGGNITLGALCLITLHDHTGIPVLLLAYLFVGIGVGIGFANAPITNTAVSGLPAAQAGLAGAITSTARQVGAALGVAVAGGIIADTAPANLAQASRPAWLIVTACGLLLLLVAGASPDRR